MATANLKKKKEQLQWVRTKISIVQSLIVVNNVCLGEEFKRSTIGSLLYYYFFKIKEIVWCLEQGITTPKFKFLALPLLIVHKAEQIRNSVCTSPAIVNMIPLSLFHRVKTVKGPTQGSTVSIYDSEVKSLFISS